MTYTLRGRRAARFRRRLIIVAAALFVFVTSPNAGHAACVGDCNGSGEVTINELLLGVNVALGLADATACPALDPSGSGQVTVAALIQAVGAALAGCPATATPTDTPLSTPTETVAPTASATHSATPLPTDTVTPTSTPLLTSTASSTPTQAPTDVPTATEAATSTTTPTGTPSQAPSFTASTTPEPSSTPTSTSSPVPTETPVPPTTTPTDSATITPTATPTETATSTPTATPTSTPRFVDNGDGTITDTHTKLMWEKKLAGSGCLHCTEDFLSWEPGLASVTRPSVFDWLSRVNAEPGAQRPGLGGYNDWRLPSRDELWSLISCSGGPACIHPVFGPTAIDATYWTFTTRGDQPARSWQISFANGMVFDSPKNFDAHVRAVRGGQPVSVPGGELPRFIDNFDGTVTDTVTGLMWETKVPGSGCPRCVEQRYAWEPGLATSASQSMWDWLSQLNGYFTGNGPGQPGFAGYSDWRIPNRDELWTLVQCAGGAPCVDPVLGLTGVDVPYWTSTTLGLEQGRAWLIEFGAGQVTDGPKNVTAYVRAVRGGATSLAVSTPGATPTPTEPGTAALSLIGGSGKPGGTAAVTLVLAHDLKNAAVTADVDIVFDSTVLTFDSVTDNCTIDARLAETHEALGAVLDVGVLQLGVGVTALSITPLGTGPLVRCEFGINPQAVSPVTSLVLQQPLLGDANGEAVPVLTFGADITIDLSLGVDAARAPREPKVLSWRTS